MLRTAMILMLLLPGTASPLIAAENEKGMTVTVERVEEFRSKAIDGKADDGGLSSLMVHVLVKGERIAGAVRFGELTFKATDDKGNELKMRAGVTDGKNLQEVDRSGRSPEESLPSDTIRLELMMDAPPRAATQVAKLEGSVKLVVGTRAQVVVDAPQDKVNKEIEDGALKAAGVKVMLMSFNPRGGAGLGVYARFRVIGKGWAIVEMAALDDQGKVRSIGGGGGSGVGVVPSITYEIFGEQPLPEGSKLRLTVLTDVKEITVPIEIKDVPLP